MTDLSNEDLRLMEIDLDFSEEQKQKTMFVAYVNETNNGCGYTIACGKTLWKLEAQTEEEALAELKQKITPPAEDDEKVYELDFVTLYQVQNTINVPLEQWYTEHAEREVARLRTKQEKREKLEYQRLKEKYGN